MRVNNCVAGASIPSRVCPHPFHQCRTNLFPKPASDCGVIKIRHCGVRWKIVGQISPFASVIYEIQHRIYQFPLFPFENPKRNAVSQIKVSFWYFFFSKKKYGPCPSSLVHLRYSALGVVTEGHVGGQAVYRMLFECYSRIGIVWFQIGRASCRERV